MLSLFSLSAVNIIGGGCGLDLLWRNVTVLADLILIVVNDELMCEAIMIAMDL